MLKWTEKCTDCGTGEINNKSLFITFCSTKYGFFVQSYLLSVARNKISCSVPMGTSVLVCNFCEFARLTCVTL